MEKNQRSNDASQDIFPGHLSSLSLVEIATYRRSVNKARSLLFYIAIVAITMGIMTCYVTYEESATGGLIMLFIGVLVAVGFIALALLMKTKPYTAIITSVIALLLLTVCLLALSLWAFGPDKAFRSLGSLLLLPVVMIALLARHLRKAKDLQRAI